MPYLGDHAPRAGNAVLLPLSISTSYSLSTMTMTNMITTRKATTTDTLAHISGCGASDKTTINYRLPLHSVLAAGHSVHVRCAAGGPISGQFQANSVPDATHYSFTRPP